MSPDPITQLAAKHARLLENDFQNPDYRFLSRINAIESRFAAALREQREREWIRTVDAKPNEGESVLVAYDEVGETVYSVWEYSAQHPFWSDAENGVHHWRRIYPPRIAAGAATAEPTSVAPEEK